MSAITIIIVFIFLAGILIFLQGYKKISANPPYVGLETRLGERTGKIYKEGWHFFFLYPWVNGFIPVKVERISFDTISDKVRTLDLAESRVPLLITFRPAEDNIINYLNSGGESKIKTIFETTVNEKIREWCMGLEEGPRTWKELQQSKLEASSILIRKIAGDSIKSTIPLYAQLVPTWIWLRYYSKPQPTMPLESEKKWMGENSDWAPIKEILKNIENSLGEQAVKDLEKAVEARRKEIESVREGNGKILLKDLGIVVERLNIGEIAVLGEVGIKAELEAKETEERKAEKLELDHVSERLKALQKTHEEGGPGLSKEQALEMVQLAQGKATKIIERKDFSFNMDETVKELASKLLGVIIK